MLNFISEHIHLFSWSNICGPRKSGKTTFLNAAKRFFTDQGASVIALDFSDYAANKFESDYFKKKMSDLYLSEQCELHNYRQCEKYLDVIEGHSDRLSKSLLDLIYYLDRPKIFIDEVSRPLLYAAKYGYLHTMREFLGEFLRIDYYELTRGITTTSYAPLNTNVDFGFSFLENVPVNEIEPLAKLCENKGFILEKRKYFDSYFQRDINLAECYECFVKESHDDKIVLDYDIALSPETKKYIAEKRQWIQVEKAACIKAEQERQERERCEYAAPLPKECPLPSKFAGVRDLNLEITDFRQYEKLNGILKQLYRERIIKSEEIYNYLQGIERDKKILGVDDALLSLRESCEMSHINTYDSYWGHLEMEKQHCSDLGFIKVYVSVTENVISIFKDLAKFLIENAQYRFHVKTAKIQRNDHMCFWLAREDFFRFETYVQKYDLSTPLPFIAYRGKLGISHELGSFDSHTGIQAMVISSYLQAVASEQDIDLLDMYSMYVKSWNGEGLETFKGHNAQELLILLETLDVLLGNNTISDDHILLTDDADFWRKLSDSKNWYQVGKKLGS